MKSELVFIFSSFHPSESNRMWIKLILFSTALFLRLMSDWKIMTISMKNGFDIAFNKNQQERKSVFKTQKPFKSFICIYF